MAQPRELTRQSESEIHRVADSHSPKLSVAIRYAFASARAAMRRKLLSRADIKEATALGIVTLRQELKEILPKALRKIYVEGGELAASQLAGEVRAAGDYEGHPFRGNQWTEGADGDGEIDRSVPTVPRDSQGTLLDKNGEPLTVYHGSVSREVDATTLDLRDPVRPRPGQLDGIYFTSDPRAASSYTRVIGVKAPAGRIVSAQIRMQNPKDITKDIKAGQKRGLTFGDAKREALKSVTSDHDGVVFRGDQYNADEYMVRSRDQIRAVKPRNLADWRFAKREPKPKFKVDFAFDKETQSAIDWADRHAAELITQISETSREDINNAVAEFLETGDFKELRDEILAAVGDSKRADLIARNEPMRAVHEGQREAWKQAVDEGLLEENAVREWIVVGDDKVCPICEGLEGQTAELSGEYPGGYDGPPAHVSCRCSESITARRALGDFEGHPFRGNQWVSGSELDQIADVSLPKDTDEFEHFYHSFRWQDQADKVQSEGLKPGNSGKIWLSKDEIRDRGAGFAIVRAPKGQAKEGVDRVEAGLQYREFTITDNIPSSNILRVVRAIPTGSGGHSIREDELAKYAKSGAQLTEREKKELPEKYHRWFKTLGGPGSGNFGHAGRPGQVGGSAPDGGSSHAESRSKLSSGKVHGRERITGSINHVERIALVEEGKHPVNDAVEAIFKPVSGEAWTSEEQSRNQLEAFKQEHGLDTDAANEEFGSEFGFGDDEPVRETITNRDFSYADREAAAYELDEALGLGVVPPTIVREIDGKRGMVQEYVETGGLGAGDSGIDQDSVYGLAILDIATGNTDRHAGNVLIDKDRRAVAIDQGLTFPDDTEYHDNYQFRPDATMDLLSNNQGPMSEAMSVRVAKSLENTDWDKLANRWAMSDGERDGFFARMGRLRTAFKAPDSVSRSYAVRALISQMAKESKIASSFEEDEVRHIATRTEE